MPDHPLLDRVVRGRAWIAVLGVMLAGIVAMQIEVLKLGASIGRSLQRGTSLQSRNEQLRASVAELADDQRIERLAATMGMVMPAPDGVGFVSVGPATVQKAIANIHQPNTAAFLSQSVPNGAVTGAATGTSTSTASGAGTTGAVPGAGTTGATGVTATVSAGAPATGTTSSTGVSGQSTPSAPAATPPPVITTQPATPAVPVQTTSPASAATGAAGTAAIAPTQPTQPSAPTAGSGGAGVPAAG